MYYAKMAKKSKKDTSTSTECITFDIWVRGGGVLSYIGHIGMCRCEGYGFQAVDSSIGYISCESAVKHN